MQIGTDESQINVFDVVDYLGQQSQQLFLCSFNPSPAEPGYALPLQTVQIQISWLLQKPIDLDLHCLPLSM